MRQAARILAALAMSAGLLAAGGAAAQSDLFSPGWTLQPGASSLSFQSIKNEAIAESSGFASYAGRIEADGTARVTVQLDSVDTRIDLRNVRMRFLFFETFLYPEATVSTRLDPAQLADLPQIRRKTLALPFTLSLRGMTRELSADVVVTLLGADLVAVSAAHPVSLAVADFGLMEGVRKLEEAAGVDIVPTASVSFDFVFARDGTAGLPAPAPAASAPAPAPAPAPAAPPRVALEPEGALDAEACAGRFEILSRTGNIFFPSGGARLDPRSTPLLDSLHDIVRRCPGLRIEVSGHTDSDGDAAFNQRLSERRAQAVADYLTARGIEAARIVVVGHGETRPVAANDTRENKARNRRIEFAVVGN